MQLKQELLTRLITTLIIVFIVGKFAAAWFASKRRKQSSGSYKDLDRMIEQQKNMLKFAARQSQGAEPNTTKKDSKTKAEYQKSSATEVLAMIDAVQWGGGDEFTHVCQKMVNEYNQTVESARVVSAFAQFIKTDFLLSFKPLPGPEKICNLLELKIFLDLLTDELGQTAQGTPLIDLLAQRLEVTNWTLSRAIEMTLLSNEKSIQELITIALEKQSLKSLYGSRKNDLIQKQLRSGDAPASVSIFLSRIKNQFPLLIPLSPLSSLSGKDDIQGALQIFGYSNNPGDDELKKQYKKLASARHPDRILSLNPGAVAIKTASDNFAKIQAAWDILKK